MKLFSKTSIGWGKPESEWVEICRYPVAYVLHSFLAAHHIISFRPLHLLADGLPDLARFSQIFQRQEGFTLAAEQIILNRSVTRISKQRYICTSHHVQFTIHYLMFLWLEVDWDMWVCVSTCVTMTMVICVAGCGSTGYFFTCLYLWDLGTISRRVL